MTKQRSCTTPDYSNVDSNFHSGAKSGEQNGNFQ